MKKALLIISFGTSYPDALVNNIQECEKALDRSHTERDCFRAFTSSMIINKLKRRDGLVIDNPQQALERLHQQGYQDVLIQSLHIINGDEYEKIALELKHYRSLFWNLQLGLPLLSGYQDYQNLIAAIEHQSPALARDERLVLMGHGATHHAFAAYACLDHMLMTAKLPFIVGAVESYPDIGAVIERLRNEQVKRVYLMPLMLVAGDHAKNDMASSEPDSWRSQIQASGIEVHAIVKGLGENSLIQQMFIEHLNSAIHLEEQVA